MQQLGSFYINSGRLVRHLPAQRSIESDWEIVRTNHDRRELTPKQIMQNSRAVFFCELHGNERMIQHNIRAVEALWVDGARLLLEGGLTPEQYQKYGLRPNSPVARRCGIWEDTSPL